MTEFGVFINLFLIRKKPLKHIPTILVLVDLYCFHAPKYEVQHPGNYTARFCFISVVNKFVLNEQVGLVNPEATLAEVIGSV